MAYHNPDKGRKYNPKTYVDRIHYKPPIEKTAKDVRRENDSKFRQKIIKTIESRIKTDGLDDIVHQLATNPLILSHFKYLVDNGIDLEKIFKEWYQSYTLNKEKEDEFNEREHGWGI